MSQCCFPSRPEWSRQCAKCGTLFHEHGSQHPHARGDCSYFAGVAWKWTRVEENFAKAALVHRSLSYTWIDHNMDTRHIMGIGESGERWSQTIPLSDVDIALCHLEEYDAALAISYDLEQAELAVPI